MSELSFKKGDVVYNKNWGADEFIIEGFDGPGWIVAKNLSTGLTAKGREEEFFLVDDIFGDLDLFDLEPLTDDEEERHKCVESSTPVQIAERGFKHFNICRECGALMGPVRYDYN